MRADGTDSLQSDDANLESKVASTSKDNDEALREDESHPSRLDLHKMDQSSDVAGYIRDLVKSTKAKAISAAEETREAGVKLESAKLRVAIAQAKVDNAERRVIKIEVVRLALEAGLIRRLAQDRPDVFNADKLRQYGFDDLINATLEMIGFWHASNSWIDSLCVSKKRTDCNKILIVDFMCHSNIHVYRGNQVRINLSTNGRRRVVLRVGLSSLRYSWNTSRQLE